MRVDGEMSETAADMMVKMPSLRFYRSYSMLREIRSIWLHIYSLIVLIFLVDCFNLFGSLISKFVLVDDCKNLLLVNCDVDLATRVSFFFFFESSAGNRSDDGAVFFPLA